MRIIISVFMTAFVLAASVSLGQSSPGSIRSSWEKADRKGAVVPAAPAKRVAKKVEEERAYPAWESSRSPVSKPWPALPPAPTVADYHAANTLLIDSLQTLYCVSTNYLRALRSRNESLASAREPDARRQFNYRTQTAYPTNSKDALAFLFQELQTLLHNCVHGR